MSFLRQWDGASLDQRIRLPTRIRQNLVWWSLPDNLSRGMPLSPGEWISITSDASLRGWGAHCLGRQVQGMWQTTETRHSNLLELQAAFLALQAFEDLIRGAQVQLRLDNQTAVSYIARQGGTTSLPLLQLTTRIFAWAETRLEALTATYIPGRQNHLADHLSRNFPTSSEWAVNRRYLEPIFSEWGTPSVDLMATSENAQLPRFVTRFKNRKAIAQDAFSIPWTFPLVYIFPPFPLILKTLLKIAKEETHAILILPFWPRRPWFPLLLQMAAAPPIALPLKKDLLRQGQWTHQNPGRLQLAAWLLNQPDGGHRDSRRK